MAPPNYKLRRQRVFLVFAGLFLGTLALLNILGISRFVDLSFSVFGMRIPMVVAVGVLPYPITFLCTDLLSELYGRRRATELVWMGLALNVWVCFCSGSAARSRRARGGDYRSRHRAGCWTATANPRCSSKCAPWPSAW